jgi:hypothetical protein
MSEEYEDDDYEDDDELEDDDGIEVPGHQRHPSDAGMVDRGHPRNMQGGPHFPGMSGFHMGPSNRPITDPNLLNQFTVVKKFKKAIKKKLRPPQEPSVIPPKHPQEIRNLNQYMGYFTTPEGDFPVSVVADSIKEAAKILMMPGVFGDKVEEPSVIKFTKGKIAVSVPVHMTGFTVTIDPPGAEESGAHATPAQAEVKNGTEVIFTAFEPFGWRFVGWFKGEQLLSTRKVSTIEVYDPFSTLIHYTARYEFDPVLRNGRYLELGHNRYWDFKFDGWGANFEGKLVLYSKNNPDWHFVINHLDFNSGEVRFIQDTSVVQGEVDNEEGIGFTVILTPTPIGFNMHIENATLGNPFGLLAEQQLSLKWVGYQSAWQKRQHGKESNNP